MLKFFPIGLAIDPSKISAIEIMPVENEDDDVGDYCVVAHCENTLYELEYLENEEDAATYIQLITHEINEDMGVYV